MQKLRGEFHDHGVLLNMEILIRRTRESYEEDEDFRDLDLSGDPERMDPIDCQMGFDTESILIASGDVFEIPRGLEGDVETHVALLDAKGREIPRDGSWKLSAGKYEFDGESIRILQSYMNERD